MLSADGTKKPESLGLFEADMLVQKAHSYTSRRQLSLEDCSRALQFTASFLQVKTVGKPLLIEVPGHCWFAAGPWARTI
jgi:hypothetical protein